MMIVMEFMAHGDLRNYLNSLITRYVDLCIKMTCVRGLDKIYILYLAFIIYTKR